MGIVLRGGRALSPKGSGAGFGEPIDIRVRGAEIAELGTKLEAAGDTVIDCAGRIVCPAFVDLWARLGEPGYEYREDLETGARAAAAGGYATVCTVPDTRPINDTRAVTELIRRRAAEVARVQIWPMVALTRGLGDDGLAELGELRDAGAVAACTADRWIAHGGLMRRGLEYASTFDLPVVIKALDASIAAGGVAHESPLSTRLGLPAVPVEAETAALARDLELARLTGARVIISHVSSARAVELIADAKSRGTRVFATVAAAHLVLDESAIHDYDPAAKLWPPLRAVTDRQALVAGLADGVLDAVVSDHDPKVGVDKEQEFAEAEPGGTGLETAAGAVLSQVGHGGLTLERAIDAMALAPLRALGARVPGIETGARADLCVMDPTCSWRFRTDRSRSRARSSALAGVELVGRVMATMVGGELVYRHEQDDNHE